MHSPLKKIINKDKPVYSISADDTLITAAKKMAQHKVGSLLVVNGENDFLGIITERDFLFKACAQQKDLTTHLVKDIMSKDLIGMNHMQTAQQALQLMTEKRIRHIPVYNDEDYFIGLLSIGDLTKWASCRYHKKNDEVQSLVEYIQR
ncbi:CBS domain-containing protein [Facilibium subflavum]|uniref:CBS domain-containing protein n=1 Tax=Facilibium subflavum TaxID=2219058 RepID=UPI000E64B3A8|nr:CBS domain-containing protein [Facilibium subflavum]